MQSEGGELNKLQAGPTITPTRHGAILTMHYMTSMTTRQMAEQVNVSISAVHSICKRAEKNARMKRQCNGNPSSTPSVTPQWR